MVTLPPSRSRLTLRALADDPISQKKQQGYSSETSLTQTNFFNYFILGHILQN